MGIFAPIDENCKKRGFYFEDAGCSLVIHNGTAGAQKIEKRAIFTDVCEPGRSVLCDGSDNDPKSLIIYDLSNIKYGGSRMALNAEDFGFETADALANYIQTLIGRDIRNYCSCNPERTNVLPDGGDTRTDCVPIECQAPRETDGDPPPGFEQYPTIVFYVETSAGRFVLDPSCVGDDEEFVRCLNELLESLGDPGRAVYKPDSHPDEDLAIFGSCVQFFSFGFDTRLIFEPCQEPENTTEIP